ncbi:UNVERIFIED_CONTAM: putative AC transposase [Sesamum calycinum]|uniref:AC transposase n=1 Tax=Sesamum calycinum TaxID=2727403 RepID=A0AAW2KKL8_9LAMI
MIDLLFCSLLSHSLDPSPRLLNPSQNPTLPPPPPPLSSTLPPPLPSPTPVVAVFAATSRKNESSQPTSLHSSGHSGDNEEVTNQSRSSKRKQSIVWEHFTKVRGVNDSLHAKCNYCEKLLSGGSAYGTTHLKKHLNNACPKFKLEHRIGLSGSPRMSSNLTKLKVEKTWQLLALSTNFKLPCRNTIRSDVIEVYEEEKVKIYKLLDGLRCKVSLTTDIWTSEHSHVAYCCLTVHFVDDSWELQKKILAFRKMPYPHDGETLFSFMKEMILEWNLDKKLFSIVVDNATNNDVMIRKGKLETIVASVQEEDGVMHRRTRSGHIPVAAPVIRKLQDRKAPKPSATAPSMFHQFQQCQKGVKIKEPAPFIDVEVGGRSLDEQRSSGSTPSIVKGGIKFVTMSNITNAISELNKGKKKA